MAKPILKIKAPERPAGAASAPATPPIYDLSTTALDALPTSVALPPEAGDLSDGLRELAVRFIGARRRVGESLLEACRYMSEARAMAEEGQWYIFLRVTGTSPDSAESLLNIHLRAGQHPAFAEKIRSGWLNQTVAGELAKPSTPPELLTQLLEREEPLRVADVKRARKFSAPSGDSHHNAVDNPDYSGSLGAAGGQSSRGVSAPEQAPLVALLDEVAASLEAIVGQADVLAPDSRTLHALDRIERATADVRERMRKR